MENKTTPCECPMAGFCQRHGVHKSAHLHKLCQNHIGYFTMWEDCHGPNQNPQDCTRHSQTSNQTNFQAPAQNMLANEVKKAEEAKLPSSITMAKNFMKSTAEHIKGGMKHVEKDMQQERLAICAECPHIVNNERCGKCGCFLQTKTKWATSSCPIGKW